MWFEALGPDLLENAVVPAWRRSMLVQRAAAAGHRTIVSADYYLDRRLPPEEQHDIDQIDTRAMEDPKEMPRKVKGTALEPCVTDEMVAADAPALTDEGCTRSVGGQTAIWREHMPDGHFEMHTWPPSRRT